MKIAKQYVFRGKVIVQAPLNFRAVIKNDAPRAESGTTGQNFISQDISLFVEMELYFL